jgi:hypothetical protein
MGYYSVQRAEIKAQLQAVTGIGRVWETQKNATSIEQFKEFFQSGDVINACMINRRSGEELENGVGSLDETNKLEWVEKNDTWEIELRYGFSDSGTPSETTFNELVDAIETKFRFLEGLNDKSYRSYPLQRVQSGIFSFLSGLVMCHKAVWNLKIQERVESTETE